MGTKLVARFHSREVSSFSSDQDYGEWGAAYKNILMSVKIADEGVSSELDLSKGDRVFAVWVESGDGDSFGHESRVNADLVAVFKDESAAQDFAKQLTINDPTKKTFQCTDGQTINLTDWTAPWDHYFGTMDEVHVEAINVSV